MIQTKHKTNTASAISLLPHPYPAASINLKVTVEKRFVQRKALYRKISAQGWHKIAEHH